MAKKKPRGKPFPKGHKISVGNRGKKARKVASYDAEELSKKKIDNNLVSRYITVNSHLTRLQLEERLVDPNITIFEERIVRSLLGYGGGFPFMEMINRVAGKVADETIHSVKKDKYADWTTEQLEEERKRLAVENRKTLTFIEKEQGLRKDDSNENASSEIIEVVPSGTKDGEQP